MQILMKNTYENFCKVCKEPNNFTQWKHLKNGFQYLSN